MRQKEITGSIEERLSTSDSLPKPSITSLPDELTLEVLKHLSWRDLGQVARVNRDMRRVSQDNTLWRPFFKTCFSELNLKEEDKEPRAVKQRFKTEFFKIHEKIKAAQEGNLLDQWFIRPYFYWLFQVKKNGGLGAIIEARYRFNDDEVMMKALIEHSPVNILCASPRLKDDKAVALYAIERDSICWDYLSLRLKEDKDLINTIFDKGYFPLEDDVLAAYRHDLKTIRRAVSVDRKNLSKASVDVRRNKAFVTSLIKQYKDSDILCMAEPCLKKDFELQALVLDFDPDYIKRCTDEVRNNKDLMFRTVKRWPSAYKYIGLKLRDDIGFLLALIQDDDQMFYRLKALFHDTYPLDWGVCDIIIRYKSLSALQSIKILLDEGYRFVPQVLRSKSVIMFYSPEGDSVITDKLSVWKEPLVVNTPETEMPRALSQRLDPRFWAQKTASNPYKKEKSATDTEDETTSSSHSFSMLGGV